MSMQFHRDLDVSGNVTVRKDLDVVGQASVASLQLGDSAALSLEGVGTSTGLVVQAKRGDGFVAVSVNDGSGNIVEKIRVGQSTALTVHGTVAAQSVLIGNVDVMSRITTEETARANADTLLQNNMNQFVQDRIFADDFMNTKVEAEIANRTNADAALTNSINTKQDTIVVAAERVLVSSSTGAVAASSVTTNEFTDIIRELSVSNDNTIHIGTDAISTFNIATGASTQVVNIGTNSGVTTINLGGPGDTVNINGSLTTINTTNKEITDKLITLNKNGGAFTGHTTGFEIQEGGVATGHFRTDATGRQFELKAPQTAFTLSTGVLAKHEEVAYQSQVTAINSNIATQSTDISTLKTKTTNITSSFGKTGINVQDPSFDVEVGGNFNVRGTIHRNGNVLTDNPWHQNGTTFYYNKGKIGIGMINPTAQLEIARTDKTGSALKVSSSLQSSGVVAGGNSHTAVVVGGTVKTFGINPNGELGDGTNFTRVTPVTVLNISTAVAVSCGNNHTAVLLADGTVQTFGFNGNGQLGSGTAAQGTNTPVTVLDVLTAVGVSCGGNHTAVLLADGMVKTFGNNSSGQLGNGTITTAVTVACGSHHTAVLLADGTVQTFGFNGNGELGNGTQVSSSTPVTVLNISTAVAVSCGSNHTAVVLADGTVKTFGNNSSGQLGNGTQINSTFPVTVLGISTAVAVSCGRHHTAVLLADGTVKTFGWNGTGELGNMAGTFNISTPITVINISTAVAVSCGDLHTVVVLADGTVKTFGYNSWGQLGDGNPNNSANPTPVTVRGISATWSFSQLELGSTTVTERNGVIALAASNPSARLEIALKVPGSVDVGYKLGFGGLVSGGFLHTAVVVDGTVKTFGYNSQGQLGNGTTTDSSTPVMVLDIVTAIAVSCGFFHTAVLLVDGTVKTFGNNPAGQLGDGTGSNSSTPVTVLGISTAVAVSAGGHSHIAAVLADGTVKTFGYNGFGQLGDGTTTNRSTPVTVLNISTAVAVSCNHMHTAVLLADGTVQTFGFNNLGQLGDGTTTNRSTPVTVAFISTAVAVACGYEHTAVLLANGYVQTFGYNGFGQLGIGTTTDSITPVTVSNISTAVAVSCGRYHTAVLLADGTVKTFGNSGNGQLGDGTTTSTSIPVTVLNISTAIAVSCGNYHTIVVLADGTVKSFGYNAEGQLGNGTTNSSTTPVTVPNISVTGSSGEIQLGSTTVSERNGNVGIGTSTPPSAITIHRDDAKLLPGQILVGNASSQMAIGMNTSEHYGSIQSILQGVEFKPLILNPIDGNVGIGKTNPGVQLDLSTDNARKLTSNTWLTGSDIRVKEHVEDADLALCYDTIKKMKLRRFQWTSKYYGSVNDKRVVGFIAQEVKEVFPKAVLINNEELCIRPATMVQGQIVDGEYETIQDFHTLDVDQINKTLFGAVQKLMNDVENMKAELAALKETHQAS